ncbi:MAG: aminotransferase class I/II-fold pyridoxal phosphate-dependent enzyme, partial [Micrococcales bacterium]|nr:aminotransferase class I/II-fold pyridoxal phosphate-dependent enzyme [Micrococcales bacterium]
NLAGLPVALVVPGEQAPALDAAPEVPAHLAVVAHAAAYSSGDTWLDAMLTALRANVTLLDTLLAEQIPSARWTPPQATYLAWLDLRRTVAQDVDPARLLLADAKVALNPGPTFGVEGTGYARLNLATSPTVLTQAVGRMAAVLGSVGPPVLGRRTQD